MKFKNHNFGESILIYEGAEIHNSCKIGPFTIIYPGVIIEENVIIGSSCIIGKKPTTGNNQTKLLEISQKTQIEKNSLICDQVIIYIGCKVGQECYLQIELF